MYRHALPPGFVFKKQAKEQAQEEVVSMEELVEKEVRSFVVAFGSFGEGSGKLSHPRPKSCTQTWYSVDINPLLTIGNS